MHVYVHTCVYIRVYLRLYVFVLSHMRNCTCTHEHVHPREQTHIHVCKRALMCIHTYVSIFRYLRVYAYSPACTTYGEACSLRAFNSLLRAAKGSDAQGSGRRAGPGARSVHGGKLQAAPTGCGEGHSSFEGYLCLELFLLGKNDFRVWR